MSLDASLISLVCRRPETLAELQQAGVTAQSFTDEWPRAWNMVLRFKRDHGEVPTPDMVETRFGALPRTPKRALPLLLHQLKERSRFRETVDILNEAIENLTDHEAATQVVEQLQARLSSLALQNGSRPHLVDMFGEDARTEILKELELRRSGLVAGIPTGLDRLDYATGGLQPRRMVTVIGRPSKGKSWIDLLFVANAIIEGKKVLLLPLEMTLTETAFRLYTIFTYKLWGPNRVLKNTDLSHGRVTERKMLKYMDALQRRFEGQLIIADVGRMSDPYTVERLEAEVQMTRPDMFWVDYITLMKLPDQGEKEYVNIGVLSRGIKMIAARWDCVGGVSAQVNREAIRGTRVFLPRLENIANGDAIGRDCDQCVSLARDAEFLYYSLVKNRNGPEFGKTRVVFNPDEGVFQESRRQEDEEDD